MDKLKITVNGKSFEAEGNSLMEIIDKFLNESIEEVEQHINDVPQPYENYEDYLGIVDLDIAKCGTKEQYDDLKLKLNKRLECIKNHPKADLNNVQVRLSIIYEATKELIKKLDYIKRSYEAVQLYYVNVKNYNKKNED